MSTKIKNIIYEEIVNELMTRELLNSMENSINKQDSKDFVDISRKIMGDLHDKGFEFDDIGEYIKRKLHAIGYAEFLN